MHNVQPTGKAGSYRCTCGAQFTALAHLQAHIGQARQVAAHNRDNRLYRQVVQLVVSTEIALARLAKEK